MTREDVNWTCILQGEEATSSGRREPTTTTGGDLCVSLAVGCVTV